MGALFSAAVMMYFAYATYKQAKRKGEWSWRRFFILIGAIAVFFAGFMLPLFNSKTLGSRPNLLFTILFVGIVVFVGGIAYAFRKRSAPASQDSQ